MKAAAPIFRLTSPARDIREAIAPVFAYSIGMLADFGKESVFYRQRTLAEKRERLRCVVNFNLRRGIVGDVRGRIVRDAARVSADRQSFRYNWSTLRNAGILS